MVGKLAIDEWQNQQLEFLRQFNVAFNLIWATPINFYCTLLFAKTKLVSWKEEISSMGNCLSPIKPYLGLYWDPGADP